MVFLWIIWYEIPFLQATDHNVQRTFQTKTTCEKKITEEGKAKKAARGFRNLYAKQFSKKQFPRNNCLCKNYIALWIKHSISVSFKRK